MNKWYLLIVIALIGLAGCAKMRDMIGMEQEVPLKDVPAVVLDAAKGAVEGIVLSEAEMETEDGKVVYELEGTANSVEYEIEVAADGTVLEIEQEGDDDDDDDDEEEEGEDQA